MNCVTPIPTRRQHLQPCGALSWCQTNAINTLMNLIIVIVDVLLVVVVFLIIRSFPISRFHFGLRTHDSLSTLTREGKTSVWCMTGRSVAGLHRLDLLTPACTRSSQQTDSNQALVPFSFRHHPSIKLT